MLCVVDGVADRTWFAVPKPAKRQRSGNQIEAALVFARTDYLNVRTVPVMGRLWDCDDLGQGVIPVLT